MNYISVCFITKFNLNFLIKEHMVRKVSVIFMFIFNEDYIHPLILSMHLLINLAYALQIHVAAKTSIWVIYCIVPLPVVKTFQKTHF